MAEQKTNERSPERHEFVGYDRRGYCTYGSDATKLCHQPANAPVHQLGNHAFRLRILPGSSPICGVNVTGSRICRKPESDPIHQVAPQPPPEAACANHCGHDPNLRSVDDGSCTFLVGSNDFGFVFCGHRCPAPEGEAVAEMPRTTEIRRRYIADSELTDIRQEYERWLRRKNGTEDGKAENCAEFCAAYIPALLDAINAMEKP